MNHQPFDILPNKYFGVLVSVFAIIDFVFSCLLFNRKTFVKVLAGITTTFYIFVLIMAILYEINTIDFLKKIGKSDYITLNYELITLNSSNINNNMDLKWDECLKKSEEKMKGHKWDLFVLDLSFIGWYFVGLLCLGIGVLFVEPYHYTARNIFLLSLYEEGKVKEFDFDAETKTESE